MLNKAIKDRVTSCRWSYVSSTLLQKRTKSAPLTSALYGGFKWLISSGGVGMSEYEIVDMLMESKALFWSQLQFWAGFSFSYLVGEYPKWWYFDHTSTSSMDSRQTAVHAAGVRPHMEIEV